MSGIKDRVAIIGMGCTKFGERWDASAADLMVEAAYEAYEDAGIEGKDVQAAWLGTVSSFRTGPASRRCVEAGLHTHHPASRTPAPLPPTHSATPATPSPLASTISCWPSASKN